MKLQASLERKQLKRLVMPDSLTSLQVKEDMGGGDTRMAAKSISDQTMPLIESDQESGCLTFQKVYSTVWTGWQVARTG